MAKGNKYTSGIQVNAPVPGDKKTGLVPRDYSARPVGCFAYAPEFPSELLIDESEWADRLNEQRKNKSSLLDLRMANYDQLKSLDQDGKGLCWAFSSTKAVMYTRAMAGEPMFPLSAWYVAGNVKGWRDQGGSGDESMGFIVRNGVPAMDKCPEYSRRAVASDAAENAALHKVTLWWDGSQDTREATKQMVSMLLMSRPCVVDLNDMGHSMCAIAVDKLKPLTIVYDNSWGERGDHGLYLGTGARARPDGLVMPQVSIASVI